MVFLADDLVVFQVDVTNPGTPRVDLYELAFTSDEMCKIYFLYVLRSFFYIRYCTI